jgi:hypothetical protein
MTSKPQAPTLILIISAEIQKNRVAAPKHSRDSATIPAPIIHIAAVIMAGVACPCIWQRFIERPQTELVQFAVETWRTPKRIFDVHPPDQCAQLRVDLRSPSVWARLPTPVAAKAGPVPTHERLGLDDRENLQDRWKPAIQSDKEPAIIVCEPGAARQPTPQDNQLMSKHRVSQPQAASST